MATVGRITLDTTQLDALARGLGTNTGKAVASIAFQVQAQTKANIIAKDVIDTGAFLGSIQTEQMNEKTWQVHDGVEYGIHQELGTHSIAARPTMTPAVETVAAQVAEIVQRELFE